MLFENSIENKELTEQKIFKSQNLFKNHVRLGAAIKAKCHLKKKLSW